MFKAFKNRRPWAAAAISFVASPFIGMLYLNRGTLAVIYLAVQFGAAGLLLLIALQNQTLPDAFRANVGCSSIAINVLGAAHAIFIARRRSSSEPLRWYSRWYLLFAVFALFPAAALTFRTYFFQPFNATSASMSPTINVGDYFLVKKFSYDWSRPQRGDLVVFTFHGREFVKRIAGLPEDDIQMRNGRLFVNDRPLPIRRMGNFLIDCGGATCNARQYIETTSNGRSYRIIDLVADSAEDESVVFVVPPSHYFMIGDNRDNSMDSRNDLGFVPAKSILGKVSVKFIDGRSKKWTWEAAD